LILYYVVFPSEVVLYRPSHLYSKFESPKEIYTGSADDFYIEKFLKAKLHGLAGHMKQDNQDQFNKPLCVMYYKVDFKLNRKGEKTKVANYVWYICSIIP